MPLCRPAPPSTASTGRRWPAPAPRPSRPIDSATLVRMLRQRGPAEAQHVGDLLQLVAHQHHVGALHRGVGEPIPPIAIPTVARCQSGRVVHAVADHRDGAVLLFPQLGQSRDLVLGAADRRGDRRIRGLASSIASTVPVTAIRRRSARSGRDAEPGAARRPPRTPRGSHHVGGAATTPHHRRTATHQHRGGAARLAAGLKRSTRSKKAPRAARSRKRRKASVGTAPVCRSRLTRLRPRRPSPLPRCEGELRSAMSCHVQAALLGGAHHRLGERMLRQRASRPRPSASNESAAIPPPIPITPTTFG